MRESKNSIHNSAINTQGGDFINGDNNFIQKISYCKIELKSIVRQTKNVLNKIQSDISGYNLKRNLTHLPIEEILAQNQFIFIQGEAGAGKSVFAKQILEQIDNTCIISFAADQFLESSLINTLHKINIDLSIEEIFNEFEHFSNKLIYIDSFEKLLEGEAEAFQELITILKENKDIKLMVSCRSYALETLMFKYFNNQLSQDNHYVIDVPLLKDEELKYFVEKIPTLNVIVQNKNLAEIIRVPKYLSLAEKLINISDGDLSKIDIVEFKKKLWKNIIGGNKSQYEQERQKTFVKITIKRAKNLTLLTTADEFNSEIVYGLKSDGILYEENQYYAPSHDIFEDWGLIKYIDNLKIENPEIEGFYSILTNEPAIRRGFRLWVESKIEASESWIYNFVRDTMHDKTIENHWKDEVLISVIKSDLCDKFLQEYKEELLKDNFDLLKKVTRFLRISGKDFNQVPNNKGWDFVIKFLFENIKELSEIYTDILRFLYDWEQILYAQKITNEETPKYVGKLLYQILNDFEKSSDREFSSLINEGIRLLYNLSEYIPEEIKKMLDDLLIEDENEDYKIRNKKDKQIEYALSHFHSGTLPKYFPKELIALANLKWRYKKVKSTSQFGFIHHESGIEHHFGITNKHNFSYFPESAYQTFVYKLLYSNPRKALDFIIDFTNYCAENYIKSSFLKDEGFGRKADDSTKVELLYNGSIYSVYGSSYLWLINRGGQIVVPDLLQSVVVALERYLYELGQIETERTDEIIQAFFDKIYIKSNSVILISVLSSVAMAYPQKVGDKLLPLISDKNFFDWDRSRFMSDILESSSLGLPHSTEEKRLCDKERQNALKWEHRKKYYRGLTGFLIQYQICYGNFNGKLFEMIDYLESKHHTNKEDVYFQKLLSEIDARKQKVETIEQDGQKYIQISPDYSVNASLENEMQKNMKQAEIHNEHSKYSMWVSQTFQKKSNENQTYQYWKECLEYYHRHDKSKIDLFSVFPIGTLASLGLDLFSTELTDKDFDFCVDTIIDIAEKFLQRKNSEGLHSDISIYDNDSVYGSLPKLLNFKEKLTEEKLIHIRTLIFFFLKDFNQEADIHLKHLYNSFKKYVWRADYQYAYNCFIGMILYAEFFKKYPIHNRYSDEEIKIIQEKEKEILEFINNDESIYKLTDLSYSKYSHHELEKAINLFPTDKEYNFSYSFLQTIFKTHIESYSLEKQRYSSHYHRIGVELQKTMVDFLFETPFNENSKILFEYIINTGLHFKPKKYEEDEIKYIKETIKLFYYKVDSHPDSEKMCDNLWRFWEILYKDGGILFNQEFLFCGQWKYEADSWFALKDDDVSSRYLKKIEKLDEVDIKALMQLLSGIGFQSLMPQGIKILIKHLKQNIIDMNYDYGEKLIMRCFSDKIKQIKEDPSLLNDFLWFLDLMINMGSSKAYYIRENLILYKKKV